MPSQCCADTTSVSFQNILIRPEGSPHRSAVGPPAPRLPLACGCLHDPRPRTPRATCTLLCLAPFLEHVSRSIRAAGRRQGFIHSRRIQARFFSPQSCGFLKSIEAKQERTMPGHPQPPSHLRFPEGAGGVRTQATGLGGGGRGRPGWRRGGWEGGRAGHPGHVPAALTFTASGQRVPAAQSGPGRAGEQKGAARVIPALPSREHSGLG